MPSTTGADQPEQGSVAADAGLGPAEWEARAAAVWARIDDVERDEFVAEVDAAVDELDPGHPGSAGIAAFERAAARDSTGYPEAAVPLYREALGHGLRGVRRRRAVIQLASSLRNLGQPEVSIAMLTAEREVESSDLDDAVVAVLALALADVGREREGLALVVTALAAHLPRYQRSMANYARLLVEPE